MGTLLKGLEFFHILIVWER